MITILTDSAAVRAVGAEWDALAAVDPVSTPYQGALMTLGLWATLAPDVQPRVAIARNADGRLVGILPLGVHRRRVGPLRLRLLGPMALWHGSYFDAVLAPGAGSETIAAMLSAARSHDAAWDAMALPHLRERSHLRAILDSASLDSHPEGLARLVPLDSDGAMVSGQHGRDLRRRWRRTQEQFPDARYEVADTGPQVLRWAPLLVALHGERWSGTGTESPLPAADADHRMSSWLAGLADRKLVELHLLTASDQLLAGLCVLRWRRANYSWRLARDPRLQKLGLGIQVFHRAIEHAAARGDSAFDLGRGNESYKEIWSSEPTEICRVRSSGPGLRWRWLDWSGRITRRNWSDRWISASES